MSLIVCPECGRENVSEYAEACPGCGFNISKRFSKKTTSRNSVKFISLGGLTIKAKDITSFELKNVSKEFLYPIQKLEAIINSKKRDMDDYRYEAKTAWKEAVWRQSGAAADRSMDASEMANKLENELPYYEHKYENLKNKINHFEKKYELAMADQLYVLSIKTVYDKFKYYNASAPFDINKKYEELISVANSL